MYSKAQRLTHEKLVEVQENGGWDSLEELLDVLVSSEVGSSNDFIDSGEDYVESFDMAGMTKTVCSIVTICHDRTFPEDIEGWLSADGNVFYYEV